MTNNMYTPTDGAEDWKRLLAQPELHWKVGYSAHSIAYSWESVHGLPARIAAVFADSAVPYVQNLDVLAGLPEYKTPLPGHERCSQTDLLVLASNADGLVVMGVEGKKDETFGPTVEKQANNASPGQLERLEYLTRELHLNMDDLGSIRYQLLHRTVSALIEARRFHADTAVMLVQSFSTKQSGFSDYQAFCDLLGIEGIMDGVAVVPGFTSPRLLLGWVVDQASE